MKRSLIWLCAAMLPLCAAAQTPGLGKRATRHAVERLMMDNPPRLGLDTAATPEQLAEWRDSMAAAMRTLMRHPAAEAAAPVFESKVSRPGYTVERWLTYPLPGYEVPVLVLVPDRPHPTRASVICMPGFGQTKELLAGEPYSCYDLSAQPDSVTPRGAMARHFAEMGLVAVAVDSPCCGELSDNGYFDYLASSRFLLETGWSYLGLSSWQAKVALDMLRNRADIDRNRIIAAGFSLGTEPMMALGLMEPDIRAFVYNDFMCRTRERALVLNAARDNGARPYPNTDEHLIPCFLTTFDFPDIVAAFAPRPVIMTEGGMDRDFDMIRAAYAKAGAPDGATCIHYAKYADPADRQRLDTVPSGLDMDGFFRLANVDPPNHYFKAEHVLPWLRDLLESWE